MVKKFILILIFIGFVFLHKMDRLLIMQTLKDTS